MIYTKELAYQQVEELLKVQSGLYIKAVSDVQIELAGNIYVNCESKGYVVSDNYPVRIIIPFNSDKLPYVIDEGNRISEDYSHRNDNGSLCLETDASIRVHFLDGFSLTAWLREYVEPYFFSYEFFRRYGEYPFGERGHGIDGIIETYQEFFQEEDSGKVIKLMHSICESTYRGHLPCPCGSGEKFRRCHGPVVMKYYTDTRLKEIVQTDYILVKDYLVKYYEQYQYYRKTK